MSDLQVRGPLYGGQGTPSPFTGGISGQQRVSDVHARYMQAALENRIFFLSVAAAAPTAYVGAAGGVPLLALHNPLNSNKILSLLGVGIAIRATATAAGNMGIAAWSGVSVIPTGTTTPPTSLLTQVASGSVARGFVNTALTGSTALALALPIWNYGLGAVTPTAQQWMASSFIEIAGLTLAAPGNQIALGATVVPTSTTVDISMFWEEVPSLQQA